jgi:hypothetical protein
VQIVVVFVDAIGGSHRIRGLGREGGAARAEARRGGARGGGAARAHSVVIVEPHGAERRERRIDERRLAVEVLCAAVDRGGRLGRRARVAQRGDRRNVEVARTEEVELGEVVITLSCSETNAGAAAARMGPRPPREQPRANASP